MTITTGGKDYTIPIVSKLVQQVPVAKFRFTPRIYLGMLVGASVGNATGKPTAEASPSIQLNLLSYGKERLAPTMTFLNVGVGFGLVSHRPMLNLTPITYNIGTNIPLMTNLQIAPALGIGTDGNVTIWALGLHGGL
jgi:hypothetical protein